MLSCKNDSTKKLDFSFTPSLQYDSPLIGEIYSRADSVPFSYNKQMAKAGNTYQANQSDVESLIWYGRRLGYVGKMKEAIEIYSRALRLKPNEPRLYRHRGHRYISIRDFDSAIADLEKANELMIGKENKVEEDGLPNARNIPLTTLKGNIYYHLGLAYYLKGDLEKALINFSKRASNPQYADNFVASAHWQYMILREMGKDEAAKDCLKGLSKDMDIIENQSYHQLCLFYNGDIQDHELISIKLSSSSSDAVKYGWANWYLYDQKDSATATKILEELVAKGNPFSFGFIAGEIKLNELAL